jgi:ascorbate-specific PTS system EIIC-type component UlaA
MATLFLQPKDLRPATIVLDAAIKALTRAVGILVILVGVRIFSPNCSISKPSWL